MSTVTGMTIESVASRFRPAGNAADMNNIDMLARARWFACDDIQDLQLIYH